MIDYEDEYKHQLDYLYEPDAMEIAKETKLNRMETVRMILNLPKDLNDLVKKDVPLNRKKGLLGTKESVIINILKKHYDGNN